MNVGPISAPHFLFLGPSARDRSLSIKVRLLHNSGNSRYSGANGTLSPNQIGMTALAGEPIRAKLTAAPGNDVPFGGIKVIAENGWFAARSSGTEDIYKIYAESFRSEDHLRQIQQEAQDTIARVFEKAKA
jgi:phosphoglucomutase